MYLGYLSGVEGQGVILKLPRQQGGAGKASLVYVWFGFQVEVEDEIEYRVLQSCNTRIPTVNHCLSLLLLSALLSVCLCVALSTHAARKVS